MMLRLLAIGLVMALAVPVAADTLEDSEVTFMSIRELRVDREFQLSGYEKDILQAEIDQAGDDDGEVTAFDIREWQEWKGAMMTGRPSVDHVLDARTGTVVAWAATLTDATGEFDDDPENDSDADGDALTLRVTETIAFQVESGVTHSYFFPSPKAASDVDIEVPPGHRIVSTSGLTGEVRGQDGRGVRGETTLNTAVRIDFQRSGEIIGLPALGDLVGPDAKLAGSTTDLEWTDDVRVAHYTLSGEISGLDAVALRGLIDEAGNGDGAVTIEEAEDVLDRFVRTRLGTPSQMFVMGGAPGTIGAIAIDIEGVEGPVGTQNAIGIKTRGVIAFDVPDQPTELSLLVTQTARNARITVEVPEGYAIIDEGVDGLVGVGYEDGRRQVTGDEVDAGSIRIAFAQANSFAGFHWSQWLSVVLGLVGLVGVIVFLAITDRRLAKMTRAVHELEHIQRHAAHGPRADPQHRGPPERR